MAGVAVALVAAATALVAGAPAASADTAPPAGTPATVSNDALPTVQINGVVWAQVTVGNTVYATGNFSEARPAGSPAGSNQTPRANLLAYDITTGNLITTFNHSLNAQGRAITASPNGSTVYVGGDFTTVDGATHNRIAAFSTATGALITTFTASAAAEVLGLSATSSTLYAGGVFGSAGGATRNRLAAFNATSGALLNWAPTADDNQVQALVVSPDGSRVIIGGKFTTLNHVAAYGLGAVDATTGATLSFAANSIVRDAGNNAGITSLKTDGSQVYGTGFVFGSGGNFEGTFAADPTTGHLNWLEDCHGDTYDTAPIQGVVYVVSHEHNCANISSWPETNPRSYHRAVAFTTNATGTVKHNSQGGYSDFFGNPDPTQLDWYPTLADGTFTGQNQAAWSATGNSSYLSLGGEFPTVNGIAQQGLVRFAIRAAAPNKVGPVASAGLTPTLTSPAANTERVAWTGTYDSDNQNLTYRVVRDGNTATPVGTVAAASTFWQLPALSFTDTGLAPGSTHTYRIYAVDPFGNQVAGSTVSGTVQGTADQAPVAAFTPTCPALGCTFDGSASHDPDGTISSYAWTFGDGTTATGATASHTFAAAGDYTVTLTVADNLGARTTTSQVLSPRPPANPNGANGTPYATDTFNRTVAGGLGSADTGGAWTNSGGAGPRSVAPGAASLTLATTGQQTGAYLGSVSQSNTETDATITTDKVGTGNGVYLYVIGRRTGTNQEYRARLRLTSTNTVALALTDLNGSATETTLAGEQTLAGFTYTPGTQLKVRFQVTGTSPTTLRLKAWPAAQAEPSGWQLTTTDATAALQAPGAVGLTAYLSGSATNAPVVEKVSAFTAAPTSVAPTASFTTSATGLAVSANAAASSEPGGTISSYAWSWGDGVVTSGQTSTHTFAAAGTYRITLTVTDAGGLTDVTTRTVTVTP